MTANEKIRKCVRILERKMPRSLLRTSSIYEVYLILNDGQHYKPPRPIPRKLPRGGMSPARISSSYIYKKFGIKC